VPPPAPKGITILTGLNGYSLGEFVFCVMPIGLSKRKKREKIEINKNFILIITASDFLIIGFVHHRMKHSARNL
jgi:hypothetical protein